MTASERLESVLAEDPTEVCTRLGSEFDRIAGDPGREIVLFGAGPLGRRTLEKLRSIGQGPLAVASTEGFLFFDARGDVCSSASPTGSMRIPCARLDDVLADHPPTYIKMDIEGAELDALEGARQVIAAHRPVLAICAYHKQTDLWRIPQAINKLYDGYRLYAEDCWEIVCYAIPEERARLAVSCVEDLAAGRTGFSGVAARDRSQ